MNTDKLSAATGGAVASWDEVDACFCTGKSAFIRVHPCPSAVRTLSCSERVPCFSGLLQFAEVTEFSEIDYCPEATDVPTRMEEYQFDLFGYTIVKEASKLKKQGK